MCLPFIMFELCHMLDAPSNRCSNIHSSGLSPTWGTTLYEEHFQKVICNCILLWSWPNAVYKRLLLYSSQAHKVVKGYTFCALVVVKQVISQPLKSIVVIFFTIRWILVRNFQDFVNPFCTSAFHIIPKMTASPDFVNRGWRRLLAQSLASFTGKLWYHSLGDWFPHQAVLVCHVSLLLCHQQGQTYQLEVNSLWIQACHYWILPIETRPSKKVGYPGWFAYPYRFAAVFGSFWLHKHELPRGSPSQSVRDNRSNLVLLRSVKMCLFSINASCEGDRLCKTMRKNISQQKTQQATAAWRWTQAVCKHKRLEISYKLTLFQKKSCFKELRLCEFVWELS